MEKLKNNQEGIQVFEKYNLTKGNDLYKICFVSKKIVFIWTTKHLPIEYLYIKIRKDKKYIQLKLDKYFKEYLLNNRQDEIQVLCTKKEYEKSKKQYSKKYNKIFNNGTIFEVLCKHLYNQRYTKHDVTQYNIKGDIQVNGIEIQLKYENSQIVAFNTVNKVINNM